MATLSKKYGGRANVRTYCRFFFRKPKRVEEGVLCSGSRMWPPCEDYQLCVDNQAGVGLEWSDRDEDESKPNIDAEELKKRKKAKRKD